MSRPDSRDEFRAPPAVPSPEPAANVLEACVQSPSSSPPVERLVEHQVGDALDDAHRKIRRSVQAGADRSPSKGQLFHVREGVL